jgi:membrane-associated phospholipid phosphatase
MWFRGIVLPILMLVPAIGWSQAAPQADECELNRLKICGVHILEDEGKILASPFHLRAKDLLWIAPLGVATGLAIDYDAHALRSLGSDPQREDEFRRVADAGAVYLPVASLAAGYAIGAWRKDDYLRQTSILTGEAIGDAIILNKGLQYATDRQRPNQGDGTGRFYPHGLSTYPDGQSFPSNHSTAAWAFAHVVTDRYPSWKTKLLLYGLASTVSASRVVSRDHFPSDVLVGGALGYLVGGYVSRTRGEVSRRYSFSAINTPNGRGFQLNIDLSHHRRESAPGD